MIVLITLLLVRIVELREQNCLTPQPCHLLSEMLISFLLVQNVSLLKTVQLSTLYLYAMALVVNSQRGATVEGKRHEYKTEQIQRSRNSSNK